MVNFHVVAKQLYFQKLQWLYLHSTPQNLLNKVLLNDSNSCGIAHIHVPFKMLGILKPNQPKRSSQAETQFIKSYGNPKSDSWLMGNGNKWERNKLGQQKARKTEFLVMARKLWRRLSLSRGRFNFCVHWTTSCGEEGWENENEWTKKAKPERTRKAKPERPDTNLAAGKAHIAIFRPMPGLKEETYDSPRLSKDHNFCICSSSWEGHT